MSSAYAQSNLPECPGHGARWTHCVSSSTFQNGDKYSVEYLLDKRTGKGFISYANGNQYVGELNIHGQPHGDGTLTYSNGDKYVGSFKFNSFDGVGSYIFANGKPPREGIWKNNELIVAENINTSSALSRELERKRFESEKIISNENQRRVEEIKKNQTTQLSISTSLPASSLSEKRIALVIGNSSYVVRPLLNPRNDADDMSRALKNAGFEVIDIRDASLAQMRNAVRQFGDRLLTRDVGLVYYSGHGMEVRGRNYFIPINADIKRSDEIADQSLDVNLILEKMETAKKGVNILIVDACRDDPFGRSFRSSSKGLATMDAPQGTIIAFATSPGKVAADGDGRNSPYTKNLIKAMQVPNLPIEQVFKQVRRAVQQETKNQQTPWENTSLSGDFYFSVKK